VHQARGELREAIACFESALSVPPRGDSGWIWQQAEYLGEIAETYQALGDVGSARAAWTAALDLLRQAGHPLAAEVGTRLAALPAPPPDGPGG
jgi:tetratricopeptide (TPR) repeat protein